MHIPGETDIRLISSVLDLLKVSLGLLSAAFSLPRNARCSPTTRGAESYASIGAPRISFTNSSPTTAVIAATTTGYQRP